MANFQDTIAERVRVLVGKQVDEAKQEIIRLAVSEFERKIRGIVGNVAIDLSNYFSLERCGTELLIRVKVESPTSEVKP